MPTHPSSAFFSDSSVSYFHRQRSLLARAVPVLLPDRSGGGQTPSVQRVRAAQGLQLVEGSEGVRYQEVLPSPIGGLPFQVPYQDWLVESMGGYHQRLGGSADVWRQNRDETAQTTRRSQT